MSAGPKVLCVVGARPNFMKIAPIMRAFAQLAPGIDVRLVHTGQHYDEAMNEQFFRQLSIPSPDVTLEVGSASHAVQTAEIMKRFEPVLDAESPDCVLVVGDVNSTIACALVAAKKGIRIVHVEAGLRSRDRTMPEEINRVLTDQISDRLYVTEREAIDNLAAEGIPAERVVMTGNVMIDSLLSHLDAAVAPATTLGARAPDFLDAPNGFGVLTLHRPSNVDDAAVLGPLLETLVAVSARIPLVFPVHPRTRARIAALGFERSLACPTLLALPPIGYLEMLGLMRSARVVLTDSGGMQEEATALGVPCLTLRDNTERPVTVAEGTNTLVGTDTSALTRAVDELLARGGKAGRRPALWDGHAAERIVRDLARWLDATDVNGPNARKDRGRAATEVPMTSP